MTEAAARLLLGSGNAGKLREIRAILAGLPVEVLSLADVAAEVGPAPDVEETGDSFLENALLKGRAYAAWSGLATLADDSGLEVDALGGRPGIRSARYAGPGADDGANLQLLLQELEPVPPARRSARFRCAAVLAEPDGTAWDAEAAWEGMLIGEPRGTGGFGYDPVFVPLGWDRTSAEVEPTVKDAVSHRGQAFRRLVPAVQAWLERVSAA